MPGGAELWLHCNVALTQDNPVSPNNGIFGLQMHQNCVLNAIYIFIYLFFDVVNSPRLRLLTMLTQRHGAMALA